MAKVYYKDVGNAEKEADLHPNQLWDCATQLVWVAVVYYKDRFNIFISASSRSIV